MAKTKSRYALNSARSNTMSSGAVDEDLFYESFEQVPTLHIYSSRDMAEHMGKIQQMLAVNPEEWEKRVEHLKKLRSVIVANGAQYDDFYSYLRDMELPLRSCIIDLRSLVVREACITVAFISLKLSAKAERQIEGFLDPLISLIPNSAKVIASSGTLALKFILKHTQSARFVPIFSKEMSSKSSVTRRCICELFCIMCQEWTTNCLERYISQLKDSIKKGINDADQEARSISRQTFAAFHKHFPEHASDILNSIDPSRRKLIEKDLDIVPSSSSSMSSSRAQLSSISSAAAVSSSSSISVTNIKKLKTQTTSTNMAPPTTQLTNGRSRSRIGQKFTSLSSQNVRGLSLASQIFKPGLAYFDLPVFSASRDTSPSSKSISGSSMTQSQRSHGSSMPYSGPGGGGDGGGGSGRGSNVSQAASLLSQRRQVVVPPRSQGTSRDVSPTRLSSGNNNNQNHNHVTNTLPAPWNSVLAGANSTTNANSTANITTSSLRQRRISQGGTSSRAGGGGAGGAGSMTMSAHYYQTSSSQQAQSDDMGDENMSETSSLSEVAIGLTSEPSRYIDNVNEIMTMLQSNQWIERRDALLNFQRFLVKDGRLKIKDILRLSDIFGRLLNETKGGVFLILLDTVQFFIKEYHEYLQNWLPVLLSRVINKQGNNVLSTHADILVEALNTIRCTFSRSLQFRSVCKLFEEGPSSTPNLKTRNCLLIYVQSLLSICSVEHIYSDVNEKDVKLAFARIINFTMEPKSPDVRKNAEEVVWRLFDVDATQFCQLLTTLGKSFQENAMRVIHRRMAAINESTNSLYSNNNNNNNNSKIINNYNNNQMNLSSPTTISPTNNQQRFSGTSGSLSSSQSRSSIPIRSATISPTLEFPDLSLDATTASFGTPNPDEIASYIRQNTADIQSLSLQYNQQNVAPTNVPPFSHPAPPSSLSLSSSSSRKTPVHLQHQHHHHQSLQSRVGQTNGNSGGGNGNNMSTKSSLNSKSPSARLLQQQQQQQVVDMDISNDDVSSDDLMADILQELSNHNERYEERKSSMTKLTKLIQNNAVDDWDEHFKPTLFLLLEILGDSEVELRTMALKVLQDLLSAEPKRFEEYTHLTIMKILEAHRDDEKAVVTAAEKCAEILAKILPTSVLLSVLHPIVVDSEIKVKIAAIKMLQHLFCGIVKPSDVRDTFHMVAPALVKGCRDDVSQIRKCSIFCLVEVYCRLGPDTLDYLQNLGLEGTKMRLLQLFIDRRRENRMS